MPKIPIVKGKDFLKMLDKYGCDPVSVRGSHHKVFNPKTNKTSVVTVHGGQDLDKGSLKGILNQLDIDDFLDFIK